MTQVRELSAAMLAAILAQQTSEALYPFLEINHASFANPILATCNDEGADVVSGALTYAYYPFEMTIPGEHGDKLSQVTLRIENVSRDIVLAIRQALYRQGPPVVTLFAALASSPEVVEYGPVDMKLRRARANEIVVTGELRHDDVLNAEYPVHAFTPNMFPGMFK